MSNLFSLLGVAGTGKTLLTLAAGLAQCMELRRYREIVVTRVTIPVGEGHRLSAGYRRRKDDAVDGRING